MIGCGVGLWTLHWNCDEFYNYIYSIDLLCAYGLFGIQWSDGAVDVESRERGKD